MFAVSAVEWKLLVISDKRSMKICRKTLFSLIIIDETFVCWWTTTCWVDNFHCFIHTSTQFFRARDSEAAAPPSRKILRCVNVKMKFGKISVLLLVNSILARLWLVLKCPRSCKHGGDLTDLSGCRDSYRGIFGIFHSQKQELSVVHSSESATRCEICWWRSWN